MNSFRGFELINIGYGVISKFSTTNFQGVPVESRDLFFEKSFLSKFSQINFRKSHKISSQLNIWLKSDQNKVLLGGGGGGQGGGEYGG